MSLSICQVLLGAFIADFGLLPILPATYFTSRLALVTSCNACVVFLMIASVFSFHHLDLGLAFEERNICLCIRVIREINMLISCNRLLQLLHHILFFPDSIYIVETPTWGILSRQPSQHTNLSRSVLNI